MKIVIDIPEVFYEALSKTDEIVSGQRSGKTLTSVIFDAIANGTPLKGHGKLVDINDLPVNEVHEESYDYTCGETTRNPIDVVYWDDICSAPAVVAADDREDE